MENKYKVILAAVLLLTAYGFGRWSAPDKVRIETKIVEVEKKVVDTDVDKNKHKETVVVEITKPDGTKEKTTKTVEDTKTDTKTHTDVDTNRIEETSKETTRGAKVTLAALAGTELKLGGTSLIVGGIATKPILGPITLGIWGLSNSTAGVAVGLTF